jgi:hypothetical protein
VASLAQFRGTDAEWQELLAAVNRYCTCEYPRCPAHEMSRDDQRVLDGLLFARRALRPRLLDAEFA